MYKPKKKPEKVNEACHVCGRQLTIMEVFAGHYHCGHSWHTKNTCPSCLGTGKIPGTEGENCDKCNGLGHVINEVK